jgi:hypothetical protein
VLGGYILLLCVVFAIPNAGRAARTTPGRRRRRRLHLHQSLGTNWAALVLFISASAQFFCATSCMTSGVAMTYAFSRRRCDPGSSGRVVKLTS